MTQYLLQQPDTLESTAMAELGGWLTSQAEKLIQPVETLQKRYPTKAKELVSRRIEIIRNHLECHLAGKFYDELLKEIMQALSELSEHDKNNDVIGRMIETLFTKNLTSVSLDDDDCVSSKRHFTVINPFPMRWYKPIKSHLFLNSFCSKPYMLTGLVSLNVDSFHCGSLKIIEIFSQLRRLKHLTLKRIPSNDVLLGIANNCKLIETIDFTDHDITDRSLKILNRLPNLRSVEIDSIKVTAIGTAELFMACENIEHISTGSDITDVLKYIISSPENVGKQFQLKSYTNNNGTNSNDIKLAVKMCPLIQNINLIYDSVSMELEETLLQPYIGFQDLRELTLRNYCFYEHQLKDLLQVRGRSLEKLNLLYAYEINLDALKYIVLMCPNLQSLCIRYKDRDTASVSEYYAFSCATEIRPLKYLTSLNILSSEDTHCSEYHVIFLLMNCPNIENIDISEIKWLNDDIISQVLDQNPKQLMHLKELHIGFELSTFLLDRIVQYCINTPEIIRINS